MSLKLVLGSKNYSSWSLRAWLAAALSGLPFEEVLIHFDEDQDRNQRRRLSPTAKVPVLHDGSLVVWDSLAIGEYLAELAPKAGLWPSERNARARARSICAEMHSGFAELRQELPMNIRLEIGWRERPTAVMADIERIGQIWKETRETFGAGGSFLFGRPCLADAYYAPVVARFRSYGVPTAGVVKQYVDTIWAWEPMQRWCAAARSEGHGLPAYDAKR
jgi:glutathione S-transferase